MRQIVPSARVQTGLYSPPLHTATISAKQCNKWYCKGRKLGSMQGALISGPHLSSPPGNRGAYVHFKPRRDPGTGTGRLVVLAVGAGGCTIFYVSHREEVPYTHRKHAVFVSPETEKMLGLQTFTQVLTLARLNGTHSVYNSLVAKIKKHLLHDPLWRCCFCCFHVREAPWQLFHAGNKPSVAQ